MTTANTASAKSYNGYTNYETWNVALRMDNNAGGQSYWAEEARECYRDATATTYCTRREVATYALAARIKETHEEANPIGDASSVFADLLNAALSEVNWDEIAGDVLDDDAVAEVDSEEATDDDNGPDEDAN